jgi:NAD(P)-dependent dehydrogenase (short-subunit alcohol dehydrogenase family)
MFSIRDKIIFITGGNRGIGRGIAIGLAQQGARVVIAARDEKALVETSAFIKNRADICFYVTLDITSTESVLEAVDRAQKKADGTIDALINNAGVSAENVKAEEMLESDWLQVLDVNLNGYFRLGKAVVKGMIQKKAGKIINISSVFAFSAIPLASAYSVSKAAINQLTKAWAVEWARYNIQVNAIAPGYIYTDLTQDRLNDEKFKQKMLTRIPAGRFGKIEDLIGAVTFLASNASDYITGIVLPVDGGWIAG